jgi:uncharacterized membrane protein YhaH (DUF805 family)
MKNYIEVIMIELLQLIATIITLIITGIVFACLIASTVDFMLWSGKDRKTRKGDKDNEV